jgi:hypothetical protein
MKKINRFSKSIIYILVSGCIVFLSSCTKDYPEINTDKNSIARIEDSNIPFLFTAALQSVRIGDQTAQNLFADQYSQFIANNATYFPSDRYFIQMSWAKDNFNPIYTRVVPQLRTIFENTESNSAEYALADIWWVFAFHRVTDYWGPIPYFQAGLSDGAVPYDPQDEIYKDFFKRLSAAVDVLKNHTSEKPYGSYDVIYGGDVNKWIKFANTLRLRLALRVSRVDPALARTEAEAAFASGVFMTSPDDDALLEKNLVDFNKISQMSEWFEFNMSAAMESILKGYNDPRISEYFMPAETSGEYNGIRNGLSIAQLGIAENQATSNSHIGPRWSAPSRGGWSTYFTTPQNVMCTAEAYFLRAEGALLGWNMGGTAEDLYKAGIRNSMAQWGFTDNSVIETYINGTTLPVAPDDYLNSPPASDVPVKFNPTDLTIQKKQVAVQKWLALFPDGTEAWADHRRNHDLIPLYPVANSDNIDLVDPTTNWIRRIPFLQVELETNGAEVAKAVSLLDGPDKITTPLWWDVH